MMKTSVLVLISFLGLAYAHSTTLDLPENSRFQSKKCQLDLEEKTKEKARHAGWPDLIVQSAKLKADTPLPKKEYTFRIEEHVKSQTQKDFGRVDGELFPTKVHITKVAPDAISLKLIAEETFGRTDVRIDCGTMILVD